MSYVYWSKKDIPCPMCPSILSLIDWLIYMKIWYLYLFTYLLTYIYLFTFIYSFTYLFIFTKFYTWSILGLSSILSYFPFRFREWGRPPFGEDVPWSQFTNFQHSFSDVGAKSRRHFQRIRETHRKPRRRNLHSSSQL